MGKYRHQTDLREVHLKDKFKWIKSIRSCGNTFPFFCKSYCIDFMHYLSFYDRKKFEDFLSEFYEIKKRRHQVICCWQELGMTVIVFDSF